MPHIIVKMYPGRSEQQKARLAEAIVKDVTAIANVGDDAVVGTGRLASSGATEISNELGEYPGYCEQASPLSHYDRA